MKSYLQSVTIADLIRERGHKVVLTIPSSSNVWEAVAQMSAKNIGAVIVADMKDPVGIFTEKDFLMKVLDFHISFDSFDFPKVFSA